jgi:hypothetical protein
MTNTKRIWLLLVGGAMSAAIFSAHADTAAPPPAASQ